MKLIFLDSDILLDVLLDRHPHYDWALGVLLLIEQQEYAGCTSVHSLLNLHYFTKKYSGEKLARASIKTLSKKLNIITEDAVIVEKAIDSNFSDFEDAVQFYTAKSANADYIITRNTKDYKESTMPVYTAEQFLRTL